MYTEKVVLVAFVNRILRHNRNVLATAIETSPEIHRSLLQEKGFNFTYHTHCRMSSNKTAYFCYDMGFIEKSAEMLSLLRVDNV